MRIAILTSGILPVPAVQGGAVETLTDHYLEYNNRHRLHDITVYSVWHPGVTACSELQSDINHYRYVDMSSLWARVRKRLHGLRCHDSFYHYSIDYFLHEVLRQMKNEHYDLILLENRPHYALQLRDRREEPLVYHLHNDFVNGDTTEGRDLYNMASRIITVSDYIRSRVVTCTDQADAKTITVHNGIDQDAFARPVSLTREAIGCRQNDFIMAFSGRLVPEKGIMELIEAMRRFSDEDNIKLMVMGSSFFDNDKGDNPFVDQLKKRAKDMGDRIIFTGYVRHEQMADYLRLADVAVIPSTWEDPFPTTVLEGMSAGLPLITTDRGGIPEMVDSEVALVVPYKKERRQAFLDGMADAVTMLYGSTALRRRMGEASRKRSERYSKDNYARHFFQALTARLCVTVMLLLSVCGMTGRERQRVFFTFDSSHGLADNSAQAIKCTRTGRMVVSTIGHINFYDGDAFTHIDPQNRDFFTLPKYNGHYHLYFDRYHHLWLKDKKSVTCVDLAMERFVSNVDSVIKSIGMRHRVDDMFGDQTNRMWFLSGNKMYNVGQRKVMPVLRKAELHDVEVYKDSIFFLFYADGMAAAYSMANCRHLYDAAALQGADRQKYASSSVLLPDGDTFYQIRNGKEEAVLLAFDVPRQEWRELMRTPYHLNNMAIHQGLLYVAAAFGYWTFNLKTGERKHYETLQLTRNRRLQTDVNTICFDRQGGMWLGTERRGLLYSKPIKSPFEKWTWDEEEARQYGAMLYEHSLKQTETLPRHVNCRFRDSRGWVWTGTYSGLEVMKPGIRLPRVYTKKDGLQNEMVHSIVEDNNHDIWIGTSFGICHLFIRNGEVAHMETYVAYDNVPNESFVNGRAMKLADGSIIMQSLDHVVKFNPGKFSMDSIAKFVLYPKLISLSVNGRVVKPGEEHNGRVILEKAITRTREFSIDYDQNSLVLTFSGLNYFRPLQTYYRFRVKGMYNGWHTVSYTSVEGMVDGKGLLHLPMMGLGTGRYEVELQASMSPDIWPQEPFVWVVNVEEPWWRSTGIYILLTSLLALLAAANVIWFYRNTRLRMLRNNEDNEILKRVRSFADRCGSLNGEVLTPFTSNISNGLETKSEDEKAFENAMVKIVPYMNMNQRGSITMRQLADVSGMDVQTLYRQLSTNLYKNPRQLVERLRLQEAAAMLLETTLTVEQVAEECRFVSPNYFIASFYHHYRKTPADYRNSTPR
ncbi:MAG: glycosyltransferase [Prevotella sp.]|nr:glycosyltransferase [Prevotella sp.]